MDIAVSCGAFKDYGPDQLGRLCSESDIRQVELWDDSGYFAADTVQPVAVARALQEHEVTVKSVHAPFLANSRLDVSDINGYLRRYQLSCEKAAACGAAYVVVHPAVVCDEVPSADAGVLAMKNSVELWRSQTAIARQAGVRAAFENLPPSAGWPSGCVPARVAEIVSGLDDEWAGVCLDISHCYTVTVDPVDAVGDLEGVELLGMHTSDGIRSCAQDRHLPPGEGDTDWPRLFAALKDIGFAGAVVMEVKSPYLGAALLRAIGEFLKRAEGGGA
ncbi:MAG: sugar phosphate isomerase/epimerase family protein [Bacillota bacterium]|nr:sugar phosphate isomerase/epimerase [Bacillota bacterium]